MQNNDFEEQFNNPKTKGEKEQINRIKKFSDNHAEIKQIRKKLESAGDGTKKPVRWKKASTFTFNGALDNMTFGKSLIAFCAPPFVQRNCCALKAFISGGSSAGLIMSGRKMNFQPFNCAR